MKRIRYSVVFFAFLILWLLPSAGYAISASTAKDENLSSSAEYKTVQAKKSNVPIAASAINGIWLGKDTLGDIQVTVIGGELIIISHPGSNQPHEAGVMTADGSTINVTFHNGEKKAYHYSISLNTMTLIDETLPYSVVLTQVSEDTALSADEAKLIGTWSFIDSATYAEITFEQGGKIFVTIPSEDKFTHEYVYAIDGHTIYVSRNNEIEEAAFRFSGEIFLLSEDGHDGTFTRKPGPLQRMVSEPISVPSSEDALVIGTWGGMRNNIYVEWTFNGDGTFILYVPQDDTLSYEGFYTARNGQMSMTAKNATLRAQYTAYENIIGISFSETDSFGYYRKTGPMKRIVSSQNK